MKDKDILNKHTYIYKLYSIILIIKNNIEYNYKSNNIILDKLNDNDEISISFKVRDIKKLIQIVNIIGRFFNEQ